MDTLIRLFLLCSHRCAHSLAGSRAAAMDRGSIKPRWPRLKPMIFGPTCLVCAILAYNMLRWMAVVTPYCAVGNYDHAHLSCPNGRKMDEWRSSTKTESSGKNTLQCSMGCMGRCWRDLAPLFHYSGNVLLRSRSPNPGRSTS